MTSLVLKGWWFAIKMALFVFPLLVLGKSVKWVFSFIIGKIMTIFIIILAIFYGSVELGKWVSDKYLVLSGIPFSTSLTLNLRKEYTDEITKKSHAYWISDDLSNGLFQTSVVRTDKYSLGFTRIRLRTFAARDKVILALGRVTGFISRNENS